MLTDFGLAHPNINPTRRKEIKSLPDNKSDTSSYKPKSSSCDLNVKHFFFIGVNSILTLMLLKLIFFKKNFLRLTASDQVQ